MASEQARSTTDLRYLRRFLGTYLANARNQAGMTLRDLAVRAGVANSEIYKIECGDQDCRLETFIKVSGALGIPFGKMLDDVVISDPTFYHGRLLDDAQFLKLMDKHIEVRSVVAVNLGVIAAWAAHLIRCGNPRLRAGSVVYPSQELCSAFVSLGENLERVDDPATRRRLLASLSKSPVSSLLTLGLCSESILRDLIERLLTNKAGDEFGKRVVEVLGRSALGLFWFPFFPGEFNQQACTPPAFSPTSSVDNLQEVVNRPLVTPTWEQTIERAKAITTAPGSKGRLAKRLRVPQSRLSEWLSGKYEPGAVVAFKLHAEVVRLEDEAKQKPHGACSTAPPAKKPRGKARKGK